MVLIVDGFGGDNAPYEIVKACVEAVRDYCVTIKLVGKEDVLSKIFVDNNFSLNGIEIVNADDVVTMEDDSQYVIKRKPNSSMIKGLRMLSNKEGDAFISAGSSGALIVGATLIVKRIKGIRRAAFAPVIPHKNGVFMLIDSGANTVCQPNMLNQFGLMGSIYMNKVMNVATPKVALANVGIEECKGTQLQIEAYKLLKNSDINFTGNIEPREIPNGVADVVVADGFTGNIILKTYEGVALAFMDKIKGVFKKNIKTKLSALMVLSDMKALKKSFDYNEYGGAPVLGVKAPVFKAHGSSKAKTFKNAIRLTIDYVNTNIISEIEDSIKKEK